MSVRPTLRSLLAMPTQPEQLSQSVLILIDCQNTYREGVMQLEGVEPALKECARLLQRARDTGAPIVHVQHDAGPGTPYDVKARIGQISDEVAPRAGEIVITKAYPSSFEKTGLNAELVKFGRSNLVIAGFMTHVCVNSTTRAAFNHGYKPTVVASATATRSLPNPIGGFLSAQQVHDGALTALADMFSIVVPAAEYIRD